MEGDAICKKLFASSQRRIRRIPKDVDVKFTAVQVFLGGFSKRSEARFQLQLFAVTAALGALSDSVTQ